MGRLVRAVAAPHAAAAFACAVVQLAAPAPASAQVPMLDGHRFVASSLVSWSFVDTEVSSTSDVGTTDFVIDAQLPSNARAVDGRFLAVDQTIGGSVAFGGVLAVNAQLSASGILPRDSASAVIVGGHGALGEAVGGALRMVRTDTFQLTLRVDFTALEVESVIPARLPSSPRVTGHVVGVHPALAAALAVTRNIGLQGSITADWQRYHVGTDDNVTGLEGGLAATFSFQPVPLTLLLGADALHDFGRDVATPTAQAIFGPDQTQFNVEAGLYMTLRRELDLGLVFRAEVASGDHNAIRHGLFRLAYYF